jgi:hypothetical protein
VQSFRLLSLRIVGLVGAGLFAFFFGLTFSVPGWVEDFASEFIEGEVSEEIDRAINALEAPEGENALSKLAQKLQAQNEEQIAKLKLDLKEKVHEKMANALAQIRDLDCECRKKWEGALKEGFQTNIALLQAANEKLVDFVQSTYMEVVAKLKRDVRIFTGTNAGVFLLLLLVSFLKPKAISHLFLPGVLLLVSTVFCSYFYIFEQNWLLTIIYSDYLGFTYLVYLAVVFVFLCDIVFNRARITTEIVNAILSAIGSAASLVPC